MLEKYDYTKHPNYSLTVDAEEGKVFDAEKYMESEVKLRADEKFIDVLGMEIW